MKNLITKEEKDQIDLICIQYRITNYIINSDGSINVDGSVDLFNIGLTKMPIKFNKVSGKFDCASNKLTTLEGSPVTVNGNFYCDHNVLTSLEGSPTTVGGIFNCSYNELTSLEGSPTMVGGIYICYENYKLISTYSGNIDIEISDVFSHVASLPQLFNDNIDHIKIILKYQRHFEIWNDDLTLNEENFNDLILEIEDGLE